MEKEATLIDDIYRWNGEKPGWNYQLSLVFPGGISELFLAEPIDDHFVLTESSSHPTGVVHGFKEAAERLYQSALAKSKEFRAEEVIDKRSVDLEKIASSQ